MSIWIDEDGRRHVGIMVEGRRIHRRLPKDATASDAKRVESEIRSAFSRRVNIPGDPDLSRVMDLYVTHTKSLRSPETALHHATRIKPWIERYRASDARAAAAQIISDMTGHYEPATINRSLGTLKKALALAWDRNMIPENYGLRIRRLPENNQRDTTLSIEQVGAIAAAASEQVRAAIWIALFTGCRRGEILALRPADIGEHSITVRAETTKTLRTRSVPIAGPLRPWLPYVPLLINFEGLKTGFRRAREKAGMPTVTFHDLRRSCGTLMIQAGVDIFVVSKVLGHSTVRVTQERYAHLHDDRKQEGILRTFG